MNISQFSRKDIGALGEKIAAEYLRRKGFEIVDKNFARKTGEIDLVMRKGDTLHFVEVKSILCKEFPTRGSTKEAYDPSINLHAYKIQKVARTSEWYIANKGWNGESQIDGALVWIRGRDGMGRVEYLLQIL